MSRLSCAVLVTAALTAAVAGDVAAQRIAAGGYYGTTRAANLEDGLGYHASIAMSGVPLRLHAELLSGGRRGAGVACAGLAPPGECGPEAVRSQGTLWSVGAGWLLPLVSGPSWGARAVAELHSAPTATSRTAPASARTALDCCSSTVFREQNPGRRVEG